MEGRRPPPKAEHPFPGEVRFDNWRSNARHIAKWSAYTLAIILPYTIFLGYLYRDRTHIFGIKIDFTEEEVKLKQAIALHAPKIRKMGTNVDINEQSLEITKIGVQDIDLGLTRVLAPDGSNMRGKIAS